MAREHAVLIAEDDEGLRYALATAFQRAGYRVDSAASGREAVQFVNQNAAGYCAVLLDMLLPNVHGSSVLAHIARVAPKVAVIAVTGYPDRVLFADPADRHIVKSIFVKPVEPGDVVSYVQSRCRREEETSG
jgi:DNA-binding NtrC family response regulator